MAGQKFTVNSSVIQSGTGERALLLLTAPTNIRIIVKGFGIYFKGTSSSDAPAKVELVLFSDTGTGGLATADVGKKNTDNTETIQTADLEGIWATTEPTISEVLKRVHAPVQQGYEVQEDGGEEWDIPGGANVGVVVTSATDIACNVFMNVEE